MTFVKDTMSAKEYCVIAFFIVILGAATIISPLAGLYLIILSFLFLNFDRIALRIPAEFFAVICMSIIAGSIKIGYGHGDDYYNVYIPAYELIKQGKSIFSFFSGGVEFGLPLFFYLLNKIFPDANYVQISGIITFIYSMLFIIWIERFFLRGVQDKYKGVAVASLLIFFNYIILVHLMRQSLATLFVLFSLGFFLENKNTKGVIYFLIACVCHLSSAIIVPLFLVFFSRNKKLKITSVAVISIAALAFKVMVGFIVAHNMFGVATYKMAVYNDDVIETTAGAGFILHFILLFIMSWKINDEKLTKYKSLIIYSCPAYLMLTMIPFASDRLFMPITGFILGGLFFICFQRYFTLFRVLLLGYCILRFIRLGPLSDHIYELWDNYPWLGSVFI